MTERELDDFLREGFIIANTPEYIELPDEPFPVSKAFERKMAQLLTNPKRYLKKLERAARPLWRKALSTAAAVLVAVSLSLGGVITVSPTARAWVQKVVVQWLEEYVGFEFRGDEVHTEGIWKPTWLPEGFEEVESDSWNSNYGRITFQGRDGTLLHFSYQPIIDGNQFNIDNEDTECTTINLENGLAYLFIANSKGEDDLIVWTNAEETIAFRIMGNIESSDLIQMAESVNN